MNDLAEAINKIVDEEAARYEGTCGYDKSQIGRSHFFPALGEVIARNWDELEKEAM